MTNLIITLVVVLALALLGMWTGSLFLTVVGCILTVGVLVLIVWRVRSEKIK